MADYIYITNETLKWFLPLLPESEQRALREDPKVYAVGAVVNSTACGIMVIQSIENENVGQIRYLIVADDYRRQGIGTGMVQRLCDVLYEEATLLMCPFGASGKSDPLYRFFTSMWNFTIEEEVGYHCRLPFEKLKGNKKLASIKGKGRPVVPFFSLTEREQRSFRNKLVEQDVPYLKDISEEDFIKELCMCCRTDSGAVSAAVFMTRESEGSDIELAFAWGAPGSQKDLMGLFGHISSMISDRGDGYLNIAAVDEASINLVEKILPEREIVRQYYIAFWDME